MTKRTRKSPVAKSLVKNSLSAYLGAVEIHNKPIFKYRYEVVVILIINSWELALKAYIYKYLKRSVRLFLPDGRTKEFSECLDCVKSNLTSEFSSSYENIFLLYEYRNKFVHFYSEQMDVIIYALLKRNVEMYCEFQKKYFGIDVGKLYDFVLLPIGFKKIYSPIDFISNESYIRDSNPQVKEFLLSVVNSIRSLHQAGIEESIIVDFSLALQSERNIRNADIIAGVNNSTAQSLNFNVVRELRSVSTGRPTEGAPVRIVGSREDAQATLVYTEIQDGIFQEINNVLQSNRLLSSNHQKFVLGEEVYYRIYAERHHVTKVVENFDMLFDAGALKFNAPSIYWLLHLPDIKIANLFNSDIGQFKSDSVTFLLKLATILGNGYLDLCLNKLEARYGSVAQPPEYYFSARKIKNYRCPILPLKALRIGVNQKLTIPALSKSVLYRDLVEDKAQATQLLSDLCLKIFEGDKSERISSRALDLIVHEEKIREKSEAIHSLIQWD